MLNYSALYPINNATRTAQTLDGMWKLQFDPSAVGEKEGWSKGLPCAESIPVPSSFSDLFTEAKKRDYCGDFWYETSFFVPADWQDSAVWVRFGSLTHRGVVYCNGVEITRHEGGFLPVLADVGAAVRYGQTNRVVVKLNNELSETSLPCGATKILPDGRKLAKPYFDFFNYSGIQRSVWLVRLPKQSIKDYSVTYTLNGADATVNYGVVAEGEHTVKVSLTDADGVVVATAEGKEGVLNVPNAHLWQVRNAYLYHITIQLLDGETLVDEYSEKIGIRTVRIEGTKILINDQPVYLKGFGKHEDFALLGRGFNWAVAKRDFECMKWINANCFRTSHYPYAEEWYQFADEEGFLIIDELPAVGMMRSMTNFAAAGSGKYTYFFEAPTVPALQANHLNQLEEMICRDKNHPSVFSWSLFNEPETISTYAHDYFKVIFDKARTFDPQNRPMTGALEKTSSPQKCQCYSLCDFVCLNRYYGWYISGGPEICEAEMEFLEEMDAWGAKNLNVPFVFTEYGTDTLASMHKLPGIMWSQEYQNEYLEMNFRTFDRYDFVQGELAWNFADFQTSEGILRVNGNNKGAFTRDRQPKMAAFAFRDRWAKK